MNGIEKIRFNSRQKLLMQQVKQTVKYVKKDPARNFDRLMHRMASLDEQFGSFGSFRSVMEWIHQHEGTREWFIRLITRDPGQVAAFVNNFFGNATLKWQQQGSVKFDDQGVCPPLVILFSPTMRCNLKCEGCYAMGYDRKEDMEPEIMEKIIREGKELGIYFYTILGGEPFLVFDKLYPIIKKNKDCLFQIFTNGTLITEQIADKIHKLKNVIVAFSISGTKEETDVMRGSGVYEKVLDAIGLMRKRNLMYGMSLVLTSKNFQTFMSKSFLKFWEDQGIVFGWNFLFMPVGKNPDLSLMPTPEQRVQFGEFIKRYRENNPLFLMDFWADAPTVNGCIAGGRRYLHITSKGDVEPCIFAHHATHNIKDHHLLDILKSPFFTYIRMNQPHTDDLLRPCMIIDNPEIWRNACKKFNAYPTDTGASDLINRDDIVKALDEYSKKAAKVIDPIFFEQYQRYIKEMLDLQRSYSEGCDRIEFKLDPEKFRENVRKWFSNDPEYANNILKFAEMVFERYGKDKERHPRLINPSEDDIEETTEASAAY